MVDVYLYAKVGALAGKSVFQTSAQTLNEVILEISALHSEMAALLATCSYLVDETQSSDLERKLAGGARVDVLPRFAGG